MKNDPYQAGDKSYKIYHNIIPSCTFCELQSIYLPKKIDFIFIVMSYCD